MRGIRSLVRSGGGRGAAPGLALISAAFVLVAATAGVRMLAAPTASAASAASQVPLPVAREVVFVVPHEDDESLFAGELLSHYRHEGAHVKLIYGTISEGGLLARRLPSYRVVRARALRAVLSRLPGAEVTVAPIPDGSAMHVTAKLDRLAAFLRRPGMLPRDSTVFVIAGDGNSDHADCREAVMSLLERRHDPVYLYWGYGPDHARLSAHRFGTRVGFVPRPRDRAFKAWAIDVYERVVYRRPAFAAFRPHIMDTFEDDVVTVVTPRARRSGGAGSAGRASRTHATAP